MNKNFVITQINRYLEFINRGKLTTKVTIQLDIYKGGIGRIRSIMEHNLEDFFKEDTSQVILNQNGKNGKGKIESKSYK